MSGMPIKKNEPVDQVDSKDMEPIDKLGCDLPINRDKDKAGTIDTMSVDSYWIDDDQKDHKE